MQVLPPALPTRCCSVCARNIQQSRAQHSRPVLCKSHVFTALPGGACLGIQISPLFMSNPFLDRDSGTDQAACAGNSVCAFVHGFEPYFYAKCTSGRHTASPDDLPAITEALNVRTITLMVPRAISCKTRALGNTASRTHALHTQTRDWW